MGKMDAADFAGSGCGSNASVRVASNLFPAYARSSDERRAGNLAVERAEPAEAFARLLRDEQDVTAFAATMHCVPDQRLQHRYALDAFHAGAAFGTNKRLR